MIHKLDFLVRFWELKARHHADDGSLSAREQVELLSLMQLVIDDLQLPPRGPCERPKSAIAVDLIGDGAIARVELRYVSAGALVVASREPCDTGGSLVLRAIHPVTRVETSFPCRVLWTYGDTPSTPALVVDGVPERRNGSILAPPRTLGLARHERLSA